MYFCFCLIILAFSLCKTMAAHYLICFLSAVPVGSVAATRSPQNDVTKERESRAEQREVQRKDKGNKMSGACGSLLHRLLRFRLFVHHPGRHHCPLLFLLFTVPIFLHWLRRPSHVG